AVARIDGRLPGAPSRGSTDTFLRLGHQARLQVQARSGGLPPVDLLTPEVSRGLCRLPEPSWGDVLLVVAPYNAQVAALRRRLSALGIDRVGTVDRFQGQEAPVVIYSCTSSSPED